MKEEAQDKRTAALRATLELISEQGFHGTPMSQIAQRANIGVGTIYRYFSGKEELINALYIDVKTRMARNALVNCSKDMGLHEEFRQLVSNVINYFIENHAELSFVEQYENSPLITAATQTELKRIAEPLEDMFKRAAEQKLLKELPIEILGALLGGSVISLAKHYLADETRPDKATLDAAIDAIWDMLVK